MSAKSQTPIIERVEALEAEMKDRTHRLVRLSMESVERAYVNQQFELLRKDLAALVAMQSRLTLKMREMRRPWWRKTWDWLLNNPRSGL